MWLPEIDDYPARLRFRFCPLCASTLERRMRDDRERLVCPADGWTFYPTPNLAATVVVEYAGGIVLLRRAIAPDPGIWHLPIGHLEFGESPAAGALRETAFEHSPSYDDPAMFYLVFCFRARAVGGTPRINHENTEIRVFPFDQVPELKWTSQRRALAAWRAWNAMQNQR